MLRLKLAISSCPNDTFAFFHFLHHSPILSEVAFEAEFLDIEELNRGLAAGRWDIVKASYTAGARQETSPKTHPNNQMYELLKSGGAIGFGVGPIGIYRKGFHQEGAGSPKKWRVGLPGENTTANFLWNYYWKNEAGKGGVPEEYEAVYMNFGEIMERAASGEVDIGVVIHEGRFVYRERGLDLFVDLGEYWQEKTGSPVPLGGIYIRKSLPDTLKRKIDRALEESVARALAEKEAQSGDYEEVVAFMKSHARELERGVIESHIETYVSAETVSVSGAGEKAIQELQKELHDGAPSIK